MKKARVNINCATNIARQYIRDNYKKIRRSEILDHLKREIKLKENSIITIYNEVASEFREEQREQQRKIANNEIRYKGRKRKFFRFNDEYLYKDLMGE